MPSVGFVGRGDELDAVAAASRAGASCVVWVEGGPGSGKSSFLAEARAVLGEADRQLWWATGDEEEQVVGHGLTGQLLSGVEPAPDPGLPPAARLERSVAEAVRQGELLIVLDDVQWCDPESRRSIRFLLRRLPAAGVMLLIAHRPMGTWPEECRKATPALQHLGCRMVALTVEEVRGFMAARGVVLTPRAARRLHRHTGGSPQLLRELAAEVDRDELISGEGPLAAPRTYGAWVLDAFRSCSPEARSVVAAVTVLGGGARPATLAALTLIDQPQPAIDEAVSRRLLTPLTRDGERWVDVSHALVRSAVAEAMTFVEASTLHERAATLTQDPLRALVHRLQAVVVLDAGLADEAIRFAEELAERGSLLGSARILILVGERTADPGRRRELLVRAADRLLVVGEVRWADRLLETVRQERGTVSASEQLVMGHLLVQLRRPEEARRAALAAWELGGDPGIMVGAAELLAYLAMDVGDGAAATKWAARAIETADTRLAQLRWASTVLASGGALLGDLNAADTFLGLHEERLRGSRNEPDLQLGRGLVQLWTGKLDRAEASLSQQPGETTDASAVRRSTARLGQAELDYRRGDWDAVMATMDTELALIDEGWESLTAAMTLAVGGYVCAGRGETARGEQLLERAETWLSPEANLPGRVMVAVARARMAASAGRPAQVVELLSALADDPTVRRIPEGVHAWRADLAEALVACGGTEAAATLLAGTAPVDADPPSLAGVLRAKASLAGALGDQTGARGLLEEALAAGPELSGPYPHARAQYELGALLRRAGNRRAAAGQLREALATFTALGATPLIGQTNRELELCALRRAPVSGRQLTPAEQAVAALAVGGMTNREIAAELNISVKTVETHLGRVFAKLGVRHRVELVRKLGAQD